MKELKNLLKKYQVPNIQPDKSVTHIMHYAKAVPLDHPTFASEIRCWHCNGSEGFWIPYDNCWSCSNPICVKKNCHPEPGISQILEEESVERVSAVSQCDQLVHILDFCERWAKRPSGFLVFSGTNGTGKTHLSKAICRDFSGESRFITMTDLNLLWIETQHTYGITTGLVREYAAVPMLVIDDIGTRTPTEPFMDFIYSIVDKRYNEKRPTILTTNLSIKDARLRFGDAIASRIFTGKVYRFEGKDRRINNNTPQPQEG